MSSSLSNPETLSEPGPSLQWRRSTDAEVMRAKIRALCWIPVWYAAAGLAVGYFGVKDLFDYLFQIASSLAFAVLSYRWCEADARLRQFPHWDRFVPALYLMPGPLLMVPVYLIATRGLQSVRSIALAAVYLFVVLTVAVTAGIVGMLLAGAA